MKTAILSSILTVGLGASAWAEGTPLDIAVGDSVIIDDFADGDYNSNLGPWVFSKAETSSLDTSIVDESGVKALKLDYTVSSGFIMPKDYPYGMQMSEGYVEAKVLLDESQNAIDLSSCTEIRFDYKQPQNSMVMMITQSFAVIDGNGQAYSKSLNSAMYYNQSFQTARIKWTDLVGDDAADDVAKNVAAFSWKISSPSMMGMSAQGSLEIANVRCVNLPVYTVKFYKGEELLQSKKYLQGETPSYDGWFEETDRYHYELRGWEPEITPVTADASYKAVLDSSLRRYEVYFYDANENQLMYSYLPYGTVPSYTGVNPVKLPTVGYSYTFKGWGTRTCDYVEYKKCSDDDEYDCDYWDEEICLIEYIQDLPPVTGETSYYPVYDSTANIYTVKFANVDGEILSSQEYAYGTKASDIVRPANPTRESKNGIVYTFKGWVPEVSDVSGHVVYVANYSAETADGDPAEIYTVAFVDENGVLEVKEYQAGDYPEYTGSAEPSKESSVMYDYIFTDWRDQNGWYIDEVDENKVYMALFEEQYRKYWIVFKDDDGSVLDSIQYEYDSYIDDDDVRELAKSYDDGYSLQKWNPELKRVTGRAVYQAVYSYEARFVAEDFYRSEWVSKGETPECRDCNPEKMPTAEYTYEFIGWDKLPAPVTDTVTYTAVFKAVPIPAAPVTNIAVGDALLIDDFEDGDEISKQGGEWFVYDDSDSEYHYSSEISKTVSVKADGSKTLEVAHKRRCSWKGGYDCDGWLGVGVTLSSGGTPVDLSQCNAIQYDYRGSEHIFKVESVLDVDYNSVRTYVDSSENWKTVTIYLNKLKYGTVDADVAFKQAKQFIWSDMMGEGIFELDNIKCLHKPTYVAKFYYGENLIDSVMVAEGDEPEYDGAFSLDSVAEEMSDDKFEYVVDWTPEIVPATKDVAYTATFTKQPRKFWISFSTAKDWSDTLVEYGKTPVYEGDLTRDPDESCKEYIFDRWVSYDYETDEDVYGLFPATRDRSYSAEYKCKMPVMITITFMDDDGETVLLTKEYPYGSYVDYYSPEKAPTARSTYRFSGWNPYFQRYAYSNMTYTAQFDENTRYYRVTFVDAEGGGMYSDDYEYGTLYSAITPPYWQPNKYSQDANYEFTGWSPALTDEDSVTGDVVFVPQYSAEYKVRFVDYDGYSIDVDGESSKYYPEGTLLSEIVKPANPTRESYSDSAYEFMGWLPEIKEGDRLTGPMTFLATYRSPDNKYTITFMDGNEILWQAEVEKDSMPKYEGYEIDPSWKDDQQYSYSWNPEDGWDKEIVKVTGPAVYVAKIKQTPKKYTIVFLNDDGTVLKTKEYEFGETITDAPTEAEVIANKTGEFRYSDKWCIQNSYTDWVCKVDGGKECIEWEEVQITNLNCYNGLQTVSENRTYVANIEYRINFYDGNGKLLNENDNGKWSDITSWYRYGDTIRYCYENDPDECYENDLPTKDSTAQYSYSWNGIKSYNTIAENAWTPSITTVTGSINYTALFDSTLRRYEVAFEDEDGSELKDAISYPYGTQPEDIAVPETPSKSPTKSEVYTFAGWNLKAVTGNVTYRATYTVSPRLYTITFESADGAVLESADYAYGTPTSDINLPTAPINSGFKFAGWTPEVATVTEDVTYKPHYVPNDEFVVTWRDEDGTLLHTENYAAGQIPSYDGTPTKESTAQYDYTFNGWTPAIAAVSGDVEYKATYTSKVRKYTVTFVNEDGSPLGTAKEYEYGTPVENIVVPEVPEKPSNEYYAFTFAGWTPALSEVTGNVTYKVLYGNMKRSFTVVFKNSAGNVWNEYTYYYNEVVNVPKYGPETYTPECEYDFDKWVRVAGESDTVKSDMEYVATHSGVCQTREYFVQFHDTLRDEWVSYQFYPYGTKAEDVNVPTVSGSTIGDCEYRFVKWSPDLADVTGHVSYETVYEKVCNEQFEVTWLGDDGKELRKSNYNKGEVPTYGDTNPAKASSAKYDYRFAGWTPDVVAVTANAQYKAKFDSTIRKYAIKFVNYDGVTVRTSAMYEYGTKANLIVAPTIPDTVVGNCTLKFDKWDKEFADVTGAATYVAQYKSVCGTNPPASSSSVVPPASSSSEPPVSSSSVTPPVSSSSVVPPASSSSVVPPASSSSEPPVVSSSSEPPVVSSSSEVPVVSSSSEPPVVSSSSVVPPASSSSVVPPASSSSVPPASSSSVTPPVSSSSVVPPASSSSVEPPASSSSGGTTSVNVAQNMLKFGYANNLLTVVQSSPAIVRVQVFDMSGHEVLAFYEPVAGSKGFSLASLERGNYMVRVSSKTQTRSARIVVK
ncbi:InlB B-repeat-containing protein [Fibrobacter sp. UWB10]|uniref:T9SS type A sorting domain-containing protein n=1 Tax=Fibrobacter sp. UWB10 TaxID=1896201 RepID=UPI002402F4C5|nr:InlB B-repeat-containing protein [Fibrobacter sp. UWB10]SMP56376.1 Por secretion system C-terminal sorting domain-containing protein [Fibrobacter sp. UWB10]